MQIFQSTHFPLANSLPHRGIEAKGELDIGYFYAASWESGHFVQSLWRIPDGQLLGGRRNPLFAGCGTTTPRSLCGSPPHTNHKPPLQRTPWGSEAAVMCFVESQQHRRGEVEKRPEIRTHSRSRGLRSREMKRSACSACLQP